jgi:protein involved in polysaccharide export with SLBB domain
MTGTGLVPPDEYALHVGHAVEVHIPGIGTLRNTAAPAGDLLRTT